MNQIMVGEILPLSLTTVDGKSGLEVYASVVDCFGKAQGNVKLEDLGSGIYVDRTLRMPDVPFVIAQYVINDEKYEMPSERFDSIPKPSEPAKFIEGRIAKRSKIEDYITGEVENEITF
jgi:hypothetical protein